MKESQKTISFNDSNFIFESRIDDENTGRIGDVYYLQGEGAKNWSQVINVYTDTKKETDFQELEYIRQRSTSSLVSRGAKLLHDYTAYSKDDNSKSPKHVVIMLYPFPDRPQIDIKKMFVDEQKHLVVAIHSKRMSPEEVEQYTTDSIELSGKFLDLEF